MAKIAVIKTGGKQYTVNAGEIIKIEKLNVEPEKETKFDTLLVANSDGSDFKLGQPSLGELVIGKVVSQGRDKKISVLKYKSKVRYTRNLGHRQAHTKVEITKINA
jgi:large subunit ribosomal protein L21